LLDIHSKEEQWSWIFFSDKLLCKRSCCTQHRGRSKN